MSSFPSKRITLHLTRLDFISLLAGFTRQSISVCRAHGGTFHLYTRTPRNTSRKREKDIYTYTNTDTPLGYTFGARARIRSRDGHSAWMHGRRGVATGSSTEEVYAPSEGCMRRGRSWRRRWRRRYGDDAAARTISHGERSYRFWPVAPADRYSRLR